MIRIEFFLIYKAKNNASAQLCKNNDTLYV